jgi:hypothetical protein
MSKAGQDAYIPHSESHENDARDWREIGYLFSQGTELLQGRKSFLYRAKRNASASTDWLR